MMEVLAQFLRSLHLPEARGPEGAPSPIRPPAAHLPLSKLLQELPEVIVEVFLVMEVFFIVFGSSKKMNALPVPR